MEGLKTIVKEYMNNLVIEELLKLGVATGLTIVAIKIRNFMSDHSRGL